MKDPEKFGLSESVSEDLDDMLVAAGESTVLLQLLLQFFKEMFEIAKPFTNMETKKITAPKGQLPIEKLSPGLKQKIDKIDGAFVDTMSYCGWISTFSDGYKKVKQKLDKQSSNLGERLR